MCRDKQNQMGSALLTALFIMTLVAIVATAMSMRLQLDIYRTRLVLAHDKLYLASQAVTFWGLGELANKNNHFNKLLKNGMVAQYPQNMSAIVPQVQLSGGLYDLQAVYNLNSALDDKKMLIFINLLNKTIPNLGRNGATNLAGTLRDWLSNYDPSRGKDNYTAYYIAQKPPYYPSHQLMQSKSELRLLKDVSSELYQKIEPLVTVLPEATVININTASKKILMGLGIGVNESKINDIMQARGDNGFKDQQELMQVLEKANIAAEQVTLESTYFLNVAQANTDTFHLVVYSLMKRARDKKNVLKVSIIRQSFNVF